MTLSDVKITKVDGQTGVISISAEGILAIIGPSEKGTAAQPAGYTKAATAFTVYGNGALVEYAAYELDVTQNQVLLVKCAPTTPGSFGTVSFVGTGTSVVSGDTSAVSPLDDYDVLITVVAGGTIGVSGATYTYSLDGGLSVSPITALGAASSISISNSGVRLALASGNLVAGDVVSVRAVGPVMSDSDVAVALEALRLSTASFEGVMITGTTGASGVQALQSWLDARESEGREYHGYANTRMRNAGESDATYKGVLDGIYGAVAAPSVTVSADGGRVLSLLANRRSYVRPTALFLASRAMAGDISIMPSRVSDGPLKGVSIIDSRGTPAFHDESQNPGLATSRFTVLRTRNGRTGVYVELPYLFSAVGSDYVFLPHVRVMNRACAIARSALTGELSTGKQKGADGKILESEAQRIDSTVKAPLFAQLKSPKRVSDTGFVLSRTDDVSSNSGATLHGDVWIVALIYVTAIEVQAKYLSKSISV